MKKTFCEVCREDVSYLVEDAAMTGELKGTEYEFRGEKASCSSCGNEVWVSEIEATNLELLYDAYREGNGIIALSKVRQIPVKYGIGKRPLSLLLGWGEMTFSRYCDGYVPTKQYSRVLQRIDDDPSYFLSLLESGKDRIRPKAYEKSRLAVSKLIEGTVEDASRIDQVVGYLLHHCEDITQLALHKMLYYVQGFSFAFLGRPMFDDDCEAWVHGPVYRGVYSRYAEYRFDPSDRHEIPDDLVFTDIEKAVIDGVIRNFGCYSGKILEGFTHSEAPWLNTRGDLPANMNSTRIISKEEIEQYFIAVKRKYDMLTPNDIYSYARSMFRSVC